MECSQVSLAGCTIAPRPGTASPHTQVWGHPVPGTLSSHRQHARATGATQRPCPAAHGGREVPRTYLGDGGCIWQVVEDWSIVVTVLHDDRELAGDLPGVREGAG